MQLEAIASCPIISYLGEETNTHLTATSFQVVVESDKVSPQPSLLQTEQPQCPPLLLIRLAVRCSLTTADNASPLFTTKTPHASTDYTASDPESYHANFLAQLRDGIFEFDSVMEGS